MVLALVPQHAERIGPPRTLAVPYALGRPLGVPGDAAFQHRVLSAALALFESSGDACFITYEEDAPVGLAEDEVPWACPVSFSSSATEDSPSARVIQELQLLAPWYNKGGGDRDAEHGLAGFTRDELVRYITSFVEEGEIRKSADRTAAERLKLAVEDLKTFYNVAASEQPGSASVREIENWYWGETEAGKLVRRVKAALLDHPDKVVALTAAALLVPGSQAHRDQA